MKSEDKKYVWWGLLGIGVAALFYFLSAKQAKQGSNTVTVPYLVPQYTSGASPTASTSLSNQPNIVGSSSNSQVSNFSNPLNPPANPFEQTSTWAPQLIYSSPTGPFNNVNSGGFPQQSALLGNGISAQQSPVHF